MSEEGAQKTSKRKKQSKQQEMDLSPEERLRRERQRQLQKLALQRRAEGLRYKMQMFKSAKLVEGSLNLPKKKPKASKKDEPLKRPFEKVDVVVVPIFWNMYKKEKGQVMEAAEKVLSQLKELGARATIDASTKYTPGQKMKYWETEGVRVRIEVGPREASAGSCVLALAKRPGEVADKEVVKVGTALTARVVPLLEQLKGKKKGGKSLPAVDLDDKANEQEESEILDDAENIESEEAAPSLIGTKPPKLGKKKLKTGSGEAQEDLEAETAEVGVSGRVLGGEKGDDAGKRKKKKAKVSGDGTSVGAVESESPGRDHANGRNQSAHFEEDGYTAMGVSQGHVNPDALEDDFGDIDFEAEEEINLSRKEKKSLEKQKKKSAKLKLREPELLEEAEGPKVVSSNRKKRKLVVF